MTTSRTSVPRWLLATVALTLAVGSLLPAVLFASSFSTMCLGQDTVAPPTPGSLRAQLCESEALVEIVILVAPACVLLVGGVIAARRRAWTPVFATAILASVVLVVSLAVVA
jgi:hypothetical protein